MNATIEQTATVTWTNFNGQWMLRSTEKLDTRSEVLVTKKNGSSSTEIVGEYEKFFPERTGMPAAHIYSVCNF